MISGYVFYLGTSLDGRRVDSRTLVGLRKCQVCLCVSEVYRHSREVSTRHREPVFVRVSRATLPGHINVCWCLSSSCLGEKIMSTVGLSAVKMACFCNHLHLYVHYVCATVRIPACMQQTSVVFDIQRCIVCPLIISICLVIWNRYKDISN